jgi:lipoprotein-anchoring transpeptidase ErfK/SrfK
MKSTSLKCKLHVVAFAFLLAGFAQATQAQPFSIAGAMQVGGDEPNPTITADDDVTPQITRQEIVFSSDLPVGSILVKTKLRKLYFIESSGMAIEYAVSVGREGFSWAVSGMMMPPLVFSSAVMRRTTMRSCKGRNLVLAMASSSALERMRVTK